MQDNLAPTSRCSTHLIFQVGFLFPTELICRGRGKGPNEGRILIQTKHTHKTSTHSWCDNVTRKISLKALLIRGYISNKSLTLERIERFEGIVSRDRVM